jgi:hypothetical protein
MRQALATITRLSSAFAATKHAKKSVAHNMPHGDAQWTRGRASVLFIISAMRSTTQASGSAGSPSRRTLW